MKNVLSDEKIRKEFLKGAPSNDSKVVKAFVAANASNALKTRPKVSYSDTLFPSLYCVFCVWLSIASLSTGVVAATGCSCGTRWDFVRTSNSNRCVSSGSTLST